MAISKIKATKKKTSKKEKRKTSLEKEKARLLEMIEKYEKPVDFGSDVDHFDEEADEAEELANQIGIGEALRERVNEIDAVLSNFSKKNTKGKSIKTRGCRVSETKDRIKKKKK